MTEVPIIWNQSIDLLCKSMDWLLYDRENIRVLATDASKIQPLIIHYVTSCYEFFNKVLISKDISIQKQQEHLSMCRCIGT